VPSPPALGSAKNPGRRGTEKKIAPVRGDATNRKGQRVIKSPSTGIMHGKSLSPKVESAER